MNQAYNKIDIEEAMSRLRIDKEILIKLIKKFLDSDMLEKLEESFEKNNINEAKIAIHSIKGASQNIGLVGLGELAIDIESKIKENQYLDLEMLGWMKEVYEKLRNTHTQ